MVVIPKGTPLPARRSLTVTTSVDSQADMLLAVGMGESKKASENYPLSNVRLECREKAPAGESSIRLTFYAYEHSVLRIGVRYKPNEAEQEVSIIPAAGMSEEETKRLQKHVAELTSRVTPQEIAAEDLGTIPLSPVD